MAPVQVVAGSDGKWSLLCPELPAGGPYRLHVRGSVEKVIDDVLVGDVWIASGQSNMEFPLSRAQNAEKEIAAANFPQLRVVKIPRTVARQPATNVSADWEVSSPATAAHFTAVGFFFGREILQTTHVPIGIVDSTWGGTPVEAWVSREGLRPAMPGIDTDLERANLSEAELAKVRETYLARLRAWQAEAFPADTGNVGEGKGWALPDADTSAWRRIEVPNTIQSQGLKANGVFWLRRTLDVPASWAGHDLTLSLGAVDDYDTTYFNGEKVGATGSETVDAYQAPRRYHVPRRLVHAGTNVIAVRDFDFFGDGGLMGPAKAMYATSDAAPGTEIPLHGTWSWTVEREIPLVPGSVYATQPPLPPELVSQNSPTVLFNGMIAPLIPYGIRGYIWYQGESNVGNAAAYHDRFLALIRDWRTRWGEGTLPFYFVQLAAYRESPGWPYLREAQSLTRAESETGMALAIDVGDEHDIHPTNKQAVGHRLALLAREETYGEHGVEDRGPAMKSVEIEGRRVRVQWDHAKGLRIRDGGKSVLGFALAGEDGVYHSAEAKIDDRAVIVECADVPEPHSVRYAWADFIDVNLENGAGLPAEPFRTDMFPVPAK